jgi:NAD(P)-dependent dehydrogenase (short-subunit alcohol dehydrogenase family)
VNNSGVTWGESIESYPDAAFTKLLTLNVQRVFTLTQKLLPMLKKGGHPGAPGRVINVGPAVSWLLGFRVLCDYRSDRSMGRTCLDWRRMRTLRQKPVFTSTSR